MLKEAILMGRAVEILPLDRIPTGILQVVAA